MDLPPSHVYAYPQTSAPGGYGPPNFTGPVINAGQSYPPGMPNPISSALLYKGDLYCSPNCLTEFQNQAARDLFGVQTKVVLKALAATDQLQAEGDSLRPAFNLVASSFSGHPQIHENILRYPAENRTLSGGSLTPFHALAHAITGGGVSISFPIANIGLNVNLSTIPLVMDAIRNGIPVGTSPVDVSFPYDVGKDSNAAWLTLGNITLRVVGSVTKAENGAWIFAGEIRAFNDVYDANPSSHRTWLGESLTTLLGEIPLTPYEVVIGGAIPVTLSGQ